MQQRISVLGYVVAAALMGAAVLVLVSLRGGGLGAAPAPTARVPVVPAAATTALPGIAGADGDAEPTVAPAAGSGTATSVPTTIAVDERVGIIPGHWQYDSGAVCADGLREVDVTTDVALRVRALLEARGLTVDLLPEHDPDVPAPPLQNYRAAALVSIHADSCNTPGASGFKVARWRYSPIPERDDRLVECLQRGYADATGLARHDHSITIDMWNYYAFREVAVETPAAIIELGFLQSDRALFDEHRYEMALGIADGVSCYLR